MKKFINFIALVLITVLVFRCANDDRNGQFIPPENPDTSHVNDIYLYENSESLYKRYGTATRWRWNDNFIEPDERATPIRSELVIPMTQLIEYLWIEPFTALGASGEEFINTLFPPEVVFLGSVIYNEDGSAKLGFAEGGARVTILDANNLDFQDRAWLTNPRSGMLRTLHHEFTHIVDGVFAKPIGFNTISETYIGIDWINTTRDQAIKLGMMSAYGASTETEDFAEIVSNFLVMDPATFEQDFINQQNCTGFTNLQDIINCRELNEGRLLISQKVDLVTEYYKNKFDIDLYQVRGEIQSRLNNLVTTGIIP